MTRAPASEGPGRTRCFLALFPDAAGRDAARRCRDVHSKTRGVRCVDDAALHLTLRFFAEATTAQVEYIAHMLPTLARPLPAVAARRCAIWPNRARPRMAVLECAAPEPLVELARECEALARKAGFDPEPRPFRPHLTLARLRPGCPLEMPPAPPGGIVFESLALMSSKLLPTGACCHAVASVDLPTLDGS